MKTDLLLISENVDNGLLHTIAEAIPPKYTVKAVTPTEFIKGPTVCALIVDTKHCKINLNILKQRSDAKAYFLALLSENDPTPYQVIKEGYDDYVYSEDSVEILKECFGTLLGNYNE